MNKKLIPLVVIVLILSVIAIVKKQKTQTSFDIKKQMGLVKMLPKDFKVSDVKKLELFYGAKENEKVILSKKGNKWLIESSFDAPAKKNTIEKFLELMKDLEGENRVSSEEILGDFELKEKQALHIKISYGTEKVVHVLVGKKESYKACFLRNAKSNDVYRIPKDIRSEIGLWGEKLDSPDKKHWLDKTLLRINKNEVAELHLTYPHKKLSFKKTVRLVPNKRFPKKPKKRVEWNMTQGGFGKDFKRNELMSIFNALKHFDSIDVVDPSKKKTLGLINPTYKMEIVFDNGKKTTLFVSTPKSEEDPYCFIKENPNIVYQIGHFSFRNIFVEGEKLFDLPQLSIKKKDIEKIEMKTPQGTFLFQQKAGNWITLTENGKLKKDVITNIADELETLKPHDYIDSKDKAASGLEKASYEIVLMMKDSSKRLIQLGKKTGKYYYTLFNSYLPICLVKEENYKKLFPGKENIFQALPKIKKPKKKVEPKKADEQKKADEPKKTDK